MSLRFHFDEHVPNAITSALRRRGVDVTTTVQAELQGQSDETHIAYGIRDRRVIYSQDDDYLIIAAKGIEHAGIVYNAPNTKTIRQIINFLVLLDACMSQDEMRNRVEFVTD